VTRAVAEDFEAELAATLMGLAPDDRDHLVGIATRVVTRPSYQATLVSVLANRDSQRLDPDTPAPIQRFFAAAAPTLGRHVLLPTCPACQRDKVLTRRGADGRKMCLRCAERPNYGECSSCLRYKKIATTTEAAVFCSRCAGVQPAGEVCSQCHRTSGTTTQLDGQIVCLNCYPRRPQPCSSCSRVTKVASTILGGPHCQRCYNNVLRHARPCPGCGEAKILAFLAQDGAHVCATCAGLPARFACRQCGSEEHHYGRLCARCTLSDRALDILSDDEGVIGPELSLLRSYLESSDKPEQVIKWLHRGPHSDLLRAIGRGELPLSHETLATAPRDKGLIYLRDLLDQSGALPRTRPEMLRLEEWVARFVEQLPTNHAPIIGRYATWSILRKARREATKSDLTRGAVAHAKASLRGAATFLGWLNQRDLTVHSMTQLAVEQFGLSHSTTRWLPQFLTWSSRHEARHTVRLPSRQQGAPTVELDDKTHRAIISSLLVEAQIPLDARVGCLLVALFGQPATRVLRLEVDHVRFIEDDGIEVLFTDHPLVLPSAAAALVGEYLRSLPDGIRWLFPGRRPGSHRDVQFLVRHLAPINGTVSQLQNSARFKLAGAAPAKVLADMLGLTVATFEQYASLSSGSWGEYPALRAEQNRAEY
jgi:hypothetical protein